MFTAKMNRVNLMSEPTSPTSCLLMHHANRTNLNRLVSLADLDDTSSLKKGNKKPRRSGVVTG